jgi:hypothetical protein
MERSVNIQTDDFGNKIIIIKKGHNITLSLRLSTENRKRLIGNISTLYGTMTVRRVRKKHLHEKSNSYGFNHHILDNAKQFKYIRLCETKNEYLIPKEYILENGKFMYYKGQGFERQIFVSLDELEQFMVEPKF